MFQRVSYAEASALKFPVKHVDGNQVRGPMITDEQGIHIQTIGTFVAPTHRYEDSKVIINACTIANDMCDIHITMHHNNDGELTLATVKFSPYTGPEFFFKICFDSGSPYLYMLVRDGGDVVLAVLNNIVVELNTCVHATNNYSPILAVMKWYESFNTTSMLEQDLPEFAPVVGSLPRWFKIFVRQVLKLD